MTAGGVSAEELRARYEKEGSLTNRYDSVSFWDRRYHQRRFDEVVSTLSGLLAPTGSFLDVGCGTGEYVRWAAGRSSGAVAGVDLADEYCVRTRALVPSARVERCDASELPFADGEFDVVMCSEVIEHVPHLSQQVVVDELKRVAGEHLVITTPNQNAFLRVVARRVAPSTVARFDDEVGHISLLSRVELVSLALGSRWRVRPVRVHHIVPPVIGEKLRLPAGAAGAAGVVERFADSVVPRAGNAMILVCSRV